MISANALSAATEAATWFMFQLRGRLPAFEQRESSVQLAGRCRGALDTLLIAPTDGLLACDRLLGEEPYAAAPLALVAVEAGGPAAESSLLRVLAASDPDIFDSAIHGLCLASATCLSDRVASEHPLADFVMRAFHRTASAAQLANVVSIAAARMAGRRHLIAAAGRVGGSVAANLAREGCHDESPEVRQASLRAAARMGCPRLLDLCRARTSDKCDPEAVHMLGVIGGDEDADTLRTYVARGLQPESAVTSLGRLGRPEDVPLLLDLLEAPPFAEPAAHALRRMFAIEIPRGLPRQPPPGLSEEELDVWDTTGPVEAEILRAWWTSVRHRYDLGTRYQWNTPISSDPLGPAFDSLPTCVQHDLYLRERFLQHDSTPDWELETWPWRRRSPGSSEGMR